MRSIKLFTALSSLVLLLSCDVVNQLGQAYTMTKCEYGFNSVSNISLAGMDVSKGLSTMGVIQATAALSGISSGAIPMNFTLNLDVTNPNATAAVLNGMQYILSIDDVDFTSGSVSRSVNIPAGGKGLMPITIGVDLAKLMQGDSKNAVINIAKNFAGISDAKSKVSLQIKPTIMVGSTPVTSPTYIPVNFTFGGKR